MFLCSPDVVGLAALVAAGQRQNQRTAVSREIHAITGTDVDAQFDYAVADRLAIAKIADLYVAQAFPDSRLGDFVAHGVQPFRERLATVVALVAKQFELGEDCRL